MKPEFEKGRFLWCVWKLGSFEVCFIVRYSVFGVFEVLLVIRKEASWRLRD